MIKKTLLLSLLTFAVGASAQITDIDVLRLKVDANYVVNDTVTTYMAQGVVTTDGTLSGGSASFYIQDGTAGIPVFIQNGAAQNPAEGDNVTVTGNLGQFNGLQQFSSFSGAVTIVTNSSGNALPAPEEIDFTKVNPTDATGTAAVDPDYMEALEGSYVVVSNVVFETDPDGLFNFGTILITNELNQTFVVFINGNVGIIGQPVPTGLITSISGVLGQFDSSVPHSGQYQLIPRRYDDIKPLVIEPLVDFTNTLTNLIYPGDAETSTTFTEYALRPGETLTIDTLSYDISGSNVTIAPVTTGLPTGANWSFGATSGTEVPATFTYTPVSGSAGSEFDFTLVTTGPLGVKTSVWTVYVPTAEEQNVVITEFLADPNTDTNSLYFNPLNRPLPGSTNAFKDDEFIEIVNLNAAPVELIGWGFDNPNGIIHTFFDFFSVPADGTAVLYGGQLNSDPVPPSIPGMSESFSDAGSGAGPFNNSGLISLRNASQNLVARVVYTGSTDGVSSTRFPGVTDGFVDTATVVCTNVSPGLRPDQQSYTSGSITATQPTITGITNQAIAVNTATDPLPFTVGDASTPVGSLTLVGVSSNPTLVPNGNIVFGGSGASRTVTVTPATDVTGVADISISVGNAAFLCASTNFQVLVQGTNAPAALFCDDFTYPDGSLITNSAFVWTTHSGTTGQLQVVGGKAQVLTASEDVSAVVPGMPVSGSVYYSFTVNFSELPGNTGGYFAHYKEEGNVFRARLWAQTNGAAAGQFRLGIANTSSTLDVQPLPQDLSLGTTYRATVRHSLDSGESTLWVDAANEGDPSVSTTDGSPPAAAITRFALRQPSGGTPIGAVAVDDLCVGTAFASVVPPAPASLEIVKQGSDVVVTWGDPTFSLQAAPIVTGTYTNVAGATSPYTNAASASQTYYRLISP